MYQAAVFVLNAPPADSVLPLWEALRLRCAAPYHRDFTSAGFSASPIGKYHYPSDCHRQTRWQSEIQVGGSRLLPQWRGYGVPTSGLSSEIKSLAPVYSVVKMQRRVALRLGVVFCPFTYLELETEMTPCYLKKLEKIFLSYRNHHKTQKAACFSNEKQAANSIYK